MNRRITSLVALLIAAAILGPGGCTKLLPAPDATSSQPVSADAPKVVPAAVSKHADGDTLRLRLPGGTEEKVRLIGVDTPEVYGGVEPYGREASGFTKRSLPIGARVWLEVGLGERDRYGRLLGYVWLEKPASDSDAEVRAKMFNAQLLLGGYGSQLTIQPNSKYADLFTVYAREAREANRGLWALPPQ